MKKPVYYVILGILLLVFGFSVFLVADYFIKGSKNAQQYDQLSQMASSSTDPSDTQAPSSQPTAGPSETTQAPTEPAGPTEPTMIPGYANIYNENPDAVGWIRIPGTKIDYPVMHTPGRTDYYLKRDFYGNASDWGTIYIREECSITDHTDNVTIYGHCMRDGSMFAGLHDYRDIDFWREHQLIYLDTLYDYHVYEIFAVFVTSANLGEGFRYQLFINAENAAEFDEYVSTCKELALYDTGITPQYGDKLITLSTCEYTVDNGRLVVVARRVF